MDKERFLVAKPIVIDGITICQPTVSEVIDIGQEKFNEYVLPFMITKDMLTFNDENIKSQFKDFDLLFLEDKEYSPILKLEDGKSYLELLKDSLSFFLKINRENISILKSQFAVLISGSGIIHRDNFDKISDVFLVMSHLDKFKIEKIPEFKNERQRDIYEKIMAGRKRKAEKERVSFATIFNTVVHGGKSFIPYYEVEKMTIFQFYNSYKAIMGIENFNMTYSQYLAGVDPKKLDLTHWIEKIKL